MRTNFDARSSREEQPIVATFTLLTFFSFSFVLCKNKLVKGKWIQKGYRKSAIIQNLFRQSLNYLAKLSGDFKYQIVYL